MKTFIPPLRARSHLYFTPQYRRSSCNTDDEVHASTAGSTVFMKTFTAPLRAPSHLYFTSQYRRSSCNTDDEVHAPIAGSLALVLHVAISALILQHRLRSSCPHCGLNRTCISCRNIGAHLAIQMMKSMPSLRAQSYLYFMPQYRRSSCNKHR